MDQKNQGSTDADENRLNELFARLVLSPEAREQTKAGLIEFYQKALRIAHVDTLGQPDPP